MIIPGHCNWVSAGDHVSRLEVSPRIKGFTTIITAIVAIAAGQVASAQPTEDVCCGVYRSPRPLAVLLERSFLQLGWESTVPRFVLYADGRVIFTRCGQGIECSPFEAQLNNEEFDQLRQSLAPSTEFLKLKHDYALVTNVSDLPTVHILLSAVQDLHRVSVYGLFYEGSHLAAYAITGPPGEADTLPEECEKYRRRIHELLPSSARPWKPSYLRVHLEHADLYVNTPEELAKRPQKWPRGWPTPSSIGSQKIEDGVYDVFIPAQQERKLSRLYDRQRKELEFGVVFDHQRWVFSGGDPVVPGSCQWDSARE